VVDFKTKVGDFSKLLKTAMCQGTIVYKSGKAKSSINKALFSTFHLDVDKENQLLEIMTMDTWYNTIAGDFTLRNVSVQEEGCLDITDPEAILKCLSTIDGKKQVEVSGEGTNLTIDTLDGIDHFEIRQVDNLTLDEMEMDDVYGWKDAVQKTEDGFLKFVYGDTEGVYTLVLKVDNSDLSKLVKDKDITKNEETILIYKNGNFFVSTGDANANVKTKHAVMIKEKKGSIKDFQKTFYALHVIVPNLFKEVDLHIRQMDDGRLGLHIESHEENFSAVIETNSQDEE